MAAARRVRLLTPWAKLLMFWRGSRRSSEFFIRWPELIDSIVMFLCEWSIFRLESESIAHKWRMFVYVKNYFHGFNYLKPGGSDSQWINGHLHRVYKLRSLRWCCNLRWGVLCGTCHNVTCATRMGMGGRVVPQHAHDVRRTCNLFVCVCECALANCIKTTWWALMEHLCSVFTCALIVCISSSNQ